MRYILDAVFWNFLEHDRVHGVCSFNAFALWWGGGDDVDSSAGGVGVDGFGPMPLHNRPSSFA